MCHANNSLATRHDTNTGPAHAAACHPVVCVTPRDIRPGLSPSPAALPLPRRSPCLPRAIFTCVPPSLLLSVAASGGMHREISRKPPSPRRHTQQKQTRIDEPTHGQGQAQQQVHRAAQNLLLAKFPHATAVGRIICCTVEKITTREMKGACHLSPQAK